MPRMTNAEAFHYNFGIYATELWAMMEAQFLEWLNADCDRERFNAVPVVRCKNCKWHEAEEPGMVWCPYIIGSWVESDGYCFLGEREEDENN